MQFPGTPYDALKRWAPAGTILRDKQGEALDRVWKGKSSLVLMPTGTGKSLLYQLPVLASGEVGLIISPLIALMDQQVEIVERFGGNALTFSDADTREASEKMRRLDWASGPLFLFVSPERTETDGYLEYLLQKHRDRVSLVAVDEAHCISQWGHDFRPPYKAIPSFLDRSFGRGTWPTILCLTATLNTRAQDEILKDFGLSAPDVVRSESMLRTNLTLSMQTHADQDAKLSALDGMLSKHRGEKLIVYAHLKQNKKAGTRALAQRYRELEHRCEPFDADLDTADKDRILAGFAGGEIDVVIATGAFGMGIDIPNIRGVIHYLLPESLEQYYQEVGRAGRDGTPAFGTLLYTPTNARVRRNQIKRSLLSMDGVREVWREVCEAGRGEVKTLNPWIQFVGREAEYAVFHAFERIGALQVLARGPNRLGCFEPVLPEGAVCLNELLSASKIKTTAAAVRNLGLDARDTVRNIFDLYDGGALKLVQNPDKTLFFRTIGLTDAHAESIVAAADEKVAHRLAEFESFVEIVETDADLGRALSNRFG